MEDSGSSGSSSSGANSGSGANSHKRVSAFLQQCGDAKKCKLDPERQLAAKRAEKRRYEEQIRSLQGQIFKQMQKMKAMEAILDTINQQLESLVAEYTSATE